VRRKIIRQERGAGQLANRRLDNLSATVNDLFQKAVQNEQVLRRYQQFELKLLDVDGVSALLDMLLRNTLEHFQLDAVELYLYDPQNTLTELVPSDYQGDSALTLFSNAEPLRQLYGKAPIVQLMSIQGGSPLPVFRGQDMRSAALLPLMRHGVLVGSLHFGARGHQRFTHDKSTDFISHLASVVAVCFENAVNQERLHRLSIYDMLTQVKNRRAFQQALTEEVSRALRSGDQLSLLFVDLDHFKRINDNYGHPVGDRVLKAVAQHIDHLLRKTDHVCRYGGEEFALLLPNCSQQLALEIAERIRQQVAELQVPDDDGGQVSVTLSIGVSCWLAVMADGSTLSEQKIGQQLVNQADKAVYQSKASGRDCVRFLAVDCC
jgi:diguanylate cyclase (GGDEF)-like protein